MQKKLFYPLFVLIGVILFLLVNNINKKIINPIPTEFIDQFNNKKFKEDRKNWIDNMHRSNPDTDWKLLDKQNDPGDNDVQPIPYREQCRHVLDIAGDEGYIQKFQEQI